MFDIYKNKRILITGVTGFKGSWLALWLDHIGAIISGFGLEPDTVPNLFHESGLDRKNQFYITDIRNKERLNYRINEFRPEIIFHLAAQPLVSVSYENPSDTFETNIAGLVNLCDVIRNSNFIRSVIFVTSDKCYLNESGRKKFKEDDALGGLDPYSASKSCVEIIAKSYANSFFIKKGISSVTVRAGNIIGGGDWSRDRLIPDIVRAFSGNGLLNIRNPHQVRPWQHVLEALAGYLKAGEKLLSDDFADFTSWNFGPNPDKDYKVSDILDLFIKYFDKAIKVNGSEGGFYESGYLQLNSEKAKKILGWKNIWDTRSALEKTSEWYKEFHSGHRDAAELCIKQILEYEKLLNTN
jgi:CDP-glucose 4,6-dehydratase